jgi:hypothetical protein
MAEPAPRIAREPATPEAGLESRPVSAEAESPPVDGRQPDQDASAAVGRIGWAVTVLTLLVGTVLLGIKGDRGYAIVTGVVALSALINLL